jgi:uncharacterized damage-inducible protein DinB
MDIHKELAAEFDRELATTRKMLDAIPAGADMTWKANPKSMTLGRLAAHVVETGSEWAINAITKDRLEFDMANYKRWNPANKAEVLARFEKDTAEVKKLLAGFDPAKWDDNWKLIAGEEIWIDTTRYEVFRTSVLNHMIHHRAQLGRDLRSLGVPIPGTYGPSADEM